MPLFLQLSLTALLPVIVSIGLYLLEKKTAWFSPRGATKSLVYGVIFGGIAILSTEWSVDVGGASANVRDAAVLIAGLVFDPGAGVIAGVLGGVERFFATYWGAGAYTQFACSISTVLAGCIGAVLRKFMFDDKKPSMLYALGIGLVTEVLHLLMIFFTNMQDITRAFSLVEKIALPMIVINAVSVMLSVLVIRLIGGEFNFKLSSQRQIATIFQRWLLLVVVVAMLVTCGFTFVLQQNVSRNDSDNILTLNIADVRQDVLDSSDENMLKKTHAIADTLNAYTGPLDKAYLDGLAVEHNVLGIHITDSDGIIRHTTNNEYVGFDMASDGQSGEFLVLLDGVTTEYVQQYQPTAFDKTVSRKFAGVALEKGGFVQIGYDAEHFQQDVGEQVKGVTRNRHIGKTGCIIVADKNWNIVSDMHGNEGKNLDVTGIWIDTPTMAQNTRYSATVYGKESYIMYVESEGFYIVGVLPVFEANFSRNLSIYITLFIEVLVFVGLFILIYFLIKKLVVNNIRKINETLAEITGGNLDITLNVRDNEEFASLSDDINSTVDTLKNYIALAAARIDKELEFAKSIQSSSLPSIFPPYPNRQEFDLFACMDTAKEVGGDFYDFYLLSDQELVVCVADVSGKGIPAAMFMMRAKALIKSCVESGLALDEAFIHANNSLCENNAAEMFVTAWLGKLNLKTGVLTYVNAGHNPPLVLRDGRYEYLKSRAGFVLAGMENVTYRSNEIQLQPGDALFLYTDGVTEANDTTGALYGEARLLQAVTEHAAKPTASLCAAVKDDVNAFVGAAEQFDDMTMLCLEYKTAMEE